MRSVPSRVGIAVSLMLCSSPSTVLPKENPKIEKIVIEKSAHTMSLMSDGKVWKSYKIALSRDPSGPKEREGDHKVPEGGYIVDAKNPHSRFHLALHISYPNAADIELARKLGVKPGGDIEIHGVEGKYEWLGVLQRQVDWTDGCIAVTNAETRPYFRRN